MCVCVDRALLLLVSLLTWIHDWCSNYKKIVKSPSSSFSFFFLFLLCDTHLPPHSPPPHLLSLSLFPLPFYSDYYTFMTPECNVITAISAHCSAYLSMSTARCIHATRCGLFFSSSISSSSSSLFSYSFWNKTSTPLFVRFLVHHVIPPSIITCCRSPLRDPQLLLLLLLLE